MPLPVFPTHIFSPANIKVQRIGSTISGGESLSGLTDVLETDGGGYWLITMTGVELIGRKVGQVWYSDADMVRAWRAWEDYLDGGAAQCLVPIADVHQAPRPVAGGRLARPSDLLATSGDPYFPDAVGFVSPFIVATVGAAPLRETQLTINIARGASLKGGEHFSLDHATKGRRLYRVGRKLGPNSFSIRPPLREAISAGAAADFDWPSVTAQLVPGSDIAPDLANGKSATVSIQFREAF